MSTPLGVDITIDIAIRDGGVVLRAFNNGGLIARPAAQSDKELSS